MHKNHRSGQATVTLQRPANLSQSRELHWIDTLFCQRTITGPSKGQRINGEVISQPVVVVQKIVRNCLKSFRWVAKWLLQTEENVARKKLLVFLNIVVHTRNTTVEKQIPSNWILGWNWMILRPASDNAQFMRPVIGDGFPTTDRHIWNFSRKYLLWDNFCRQYWEGWSCQIQETGMNVRIYLITDAIVSTVDTRLRLPTERLLKGMHAGMQL